MKTAFALCLFVLTFEATSSAQSDQSSARTLKLPTIVFASAVTADLATTFYNLSNGTQEHNVLLQWTNDQPVATVIAGAAMSSTAVWLARRYVGRRHPKLVAVGLYVAASISTAYAIDNFRGRPTIINHRQLNASTNTYR